MSRAALACMLLGSLSCNRPDPARIVSDPIDAGPPQSPEAAPPKTFASVSCDDDSQCGWDEACSPHACVGKGEAAPSACEESGPRPGRCLCAQNLCTLARTTPSQGAKKTGCKKDDECAFEPATGSCTAGSPMPIHQRGGFCTCSAGTCTPQFVDYVPCHSNKDCSWLEDPLRPAPSTKVPRASVVPCKTGEHDSACVKGVCETRVWKC
jgi:hypothetical protein